MSASDATSYLIAGSGAGQTVDNLAYTFVNVPPAYPMTLVRGATGTCDPVFVSASQFSGAAFYGTVRYSFANCTDGDTVRFLDQNTGLKSGGAPILTIDSVTC